MQSEALSAVRALFADYPSRYWIAGGWALDLFADRVRRPHTDVDVLVLARDLDRVAETFTTLGRCSRTQHRRTPNHGSQARP